MGIETDNYFHQQYYIKGVAWARHCGHAHIGENALSITTFIHHLTF